jgi:hypothetical protein
VVDWQSRRRSKLENLLMGIDRIHITNQRTSLDRIEEINDLLSSFMINQATPHLEALSSLTNNESSNRHG